MTKKQPPKPKRGGQKGNTNALKHGFYAKRFTSEENKRLDETDSFALEQEIKLLRVCVDRLTEQLIFEPVMRIDSQGNETQDDYLLKSLNTLSAMTQSLSTLVRTHYLTRGRGGTVEQTITEALEELRLELGI